MLLRKVVVPLVLVLILGAFLGYQYVTTKQFSIYDWIIAAGVAYLLLKMLVSGTRARNN
jgi:uncharacterized membrane protein YfcA